MARVCIIGVGKVGGSMALALSRAKYSVSPLVVRSSRDGRRIRGLLPKGTEVATLDRLKKIEADIIFISTQDAQISSVASKIALLVRKGQVVFHTSGALSSEVLTPLANSGCHIGSVHPLTSISDAVRGADQFRGSYFCVEGSQKAVKLGRRIVRDLGGKTFTIKTELKPLYHAAAVTSAGHITSLFDTATAILRECGVNRSEALKILFPLAASSLSNLSFQSPEEALTGTFARLDTETFGLHVKLLRSHLPADILKLYLLLGSHSVDLVERRLGRSDETREFRKLISVAKGKVRC